MKACLQINYSSVPEKINLLQLVAVISNDMAALLQHLQCIILCTHQYRVCILYKPGAELFIADISPFLHESLYWVNINADIENTAKHCLTCLEYQNTQPQGQATPHNVLAKPLKVVGTHIFMINNENLLCIVD